jgi:hypothetical protein
MTDKRQRDWLNVTSKRKRGRPALDRQTIIRQRQVDDLLILRVAERIARFHDVDPKFLRRDQILLRLSEPVDREIFDKVLRRVAQRIDERANWEGDPETRIKRLKRLKKSEDHYRASGQAERDARQERIREHKVFLEWRQKLSK